MQYHRNATTNQNQRLLIQESNMKAIELSEMFQVSAQTVIKWKYAGRIADKKSAPEKIYYTLDREEEDLIVFCRKAELSLDDIWQGLSRYILRINRINTYRTLKRKGLNRLPQEERDTKKFKKYLPGYIHLDWFYLPRLEKKKRYCIVAIDRATRWLVVGFYNNMTKENASHFLKRLKNELPFKIRIILTDNGFSFTNKRYNRNGKARKEHLFDQFCKKFLIEHRLTKTKHPWTNGLAENTIKLIKNNTVKKHTLKDYQDAENCIQSYIYYHNFVKNHRALGFKTSFETMIQYYKTHKHLFVKPEKELTDMYKLLNNLVKLTNYNLLLKH